MAQLNGIKLRLKTNPAWWSDSPDRLYLGLHSGNSGREFRLNNGIALDDDSVEYEFGLGIPCCNDDVPLVANSNNGAHNSPTFNTLDLNTIDHVYLRKEQGFSDPSTNSDDDALFLDFAEILLCDVEGNLRRFGLGEPIVFSDEAGLHHWVPKQRDPGCRILFSWGTIVHERADKDQKSAGWTWQFKLDVTANGKTIENWDLDDSLIFPTKFPPGTKKSPDRYEDVFFPGCCGGEYTVVIDAEAIEKDVFKNDSGTGTKSHTFTCSPMSR